MQNLQRQKVRTAFALLERRAGESPWSAACVALSQCCVYDTVYRSCFAKLKLV
jgi:hypothetical protein